MLKAGVSSWWHDHSHVPSLISASRETLWLLHMWQLGHGRGPRDRRWRSRGSPECGVPPAPPPEPPSSQRWPPAAPQGHRRAVYPEFRMQFPWHRIAPHIHIVGIATFVETVESSPNQIACETAPSKRNQRARGPYIVRLGDPAIGLTRSAPQDSSSLADRPLSHRRTSTARDGGYVADDEAGAPRG